MTIKNSCALSVALLCAAIVAISPLAAASQSQDILLLSFFRDNGQHGTYLAWSTDGFEFKPLNGDKPIFPPARWPEQNLTRDPSIVFHEGRFHVVWTSGWQGNCFGYATSPDLVRWSEPVKVQPFPSTLPMEDQPRNMWAPEICWDPVRKDFAVIWSTTTDRESRNGDGSSSNGKNGQLDHRLYLSRTSDGKSFSEAKVFFDQKFCCIDGQMVFDTQGSKDAAAGRWVMVLKHEKEIPLGGKNLRLTYAPGDLSSPWSPVSQPIAGPGSAIQSKEMAEGPTLVQWANQWFLYWDAFANGHYSVAVSPDLKSWSDRTSELRLPAHPRHGTVFRAPRSAVGWLGKP